jgi:diadenosine tetraphosphate (Ap4A) HIT family hydrolase
MEINFKDLINQGAPLPNRAFVIENSVTLESFISILLGQLLSINLGTSKTLGNKGSALSFKQKIDLLTDIKYLEPSTIPKFQAFTEIRNQFAHTLDASTFTNCFAIIPNTENFLRKNFSLEGRNLVDREAELKELFQMLSSALMDEIQGLLTKLGNKAHEDGLNTGARNLLKKIFAYADEDVEFGRKLNEISERYEQEVKDEMERQGIPLG